MTRASRLLYTPVPMAVTLVLAACATPPTPAEPVAYSPEWFQCDGRFQCIVVYDAFCNFTSVNASHARIYERWANQEVRRVDEHIPCAPAAERPAPLPRCRKNRCEVL